MSPRTQVGWDTIRSGRQGYSEPSPIPMERLASLSLTTQLPNDPSTPFRFGLTPARDYGTTTMRQLNKVEGKDLARLNPTDFAHLLRTLLYAEAKVRNLASTGVHVSTAITVADGGEDGRWNAPIQPTDYIPNSLTIYQIKAQALSPQECADELFVANPPKPTKTTKGKKKPAKRPLKPAVADALTKKGCYCFFCSARYPQTSITARLTKVRSVLTKTHARFKNAKFAFLDADKIAAWANLHASAVAFVSAKLNLMPEVALRDWRAWSRDLEITKYPFESNPYLDIHLQNLRKLANGDRQIARVYGPSGVGKTRLVYEVFRPVTSGGSAPDSTLADTVVYLDLSTNADNKVEAVQQIAESGMSGTLIVDNCSAANHGKLTRFASIADATISLISIDYEEQKLPDKTVGIELDPARMGDIVQRILRKNPELKALTDDQIAHIAQFSHGFPQIAVLMAKQRAAPTIEQLTELEFVKKLLWGRDPPDQAAFELLQVLALFTNIGAEGTLSGQLTFVRSKFTSFASDHQLRAKAARFQKLRVIQPAGDYWLVAPRPLAVALAANWWETATATQIAALLPELEQYKLVEPLCQQLRLLSFSNRLTAITTDLCGPTGPFAHAELMFSQAGSQLFRALSELNPELALDALDRLVSQRTVEQLRQISGPPRRNLVWALEKLCWPAALFHKAALTLLKFAAAENESWSNNSTGQFAQLFQVFLSGTRLPAMDRLDVIREALTTNDDAIGRLCVGALGQALYTGTVTRSGGVEVRGSSLPEKDWHPEKWGDVWDYQFAAFSLLADLAVTDTVVGAAAKATAGKYLRTVVRAHLLDRAEPIVVKLAGHFKGFWPEARSSLEAALEYDAGSTPAVAQRLEKIKALLEPAAPTQRIDQYVIHGGFRHRKLANGDFEDLAGQDSVALGKELGLIWDQTPEIAGILRVQADKAWEFGEGLAQSVGEPDRFVTWALDTLKTTEASKQNPRLLIGFLSALKNSKITDDTLARVRSEPELNRHYIALARSRPLTDADVEAIVQLVRTRSLPPELLTELSYGSVTDTIPADRLLNLFMPLARERKDAINPIYGVLAMFAFRDEARWQQIQSSVRELMMLDGFVATLDDRNEHHWEEHCRRLFAQPDAPLAISLATQIVGAENADGPDMSFDSTRKRLLTLLFTKHGAETWPIIGAALLGEDSFRFSGLLSADTLHTGITPDQPPESFSSPFWALEAKVVIPWFRQHPEAVESIFRSVALFTTQPDHSLAWHPLILEMMREFFEPSYASEIGANLWSFGSSGSRVPYIQRRIRLLESLLKESKPALRAMARTWIDHFKSDLADEKKEDEQNRAGIW